MRFTVSFHNIWLTASIVILALLALASGGAMFIKTVRDPRWDHTSVSNTPASMILASTVACDSLIAFSQVYMFRRSGSVHSRRLGNVVSKLTILVVNVGLLTSIDVAVFLILFLACPLNGTFIIPYLLLCNCYLNSFLSVLNSRHLLRSIAENDIMHTSIFDIHMDITLPSCTPSMPCHLQDLGGSNSSVLSAEQVNDSVDPRDEIRYWWMWKVLSCIGLWKPFCQAQIHLDWSKNSINSSNFDWTTHYMEMLYVHFSHLFVRYSWRKPPCMNSGLRISWGTWWVVQLCGVGWDSSTATTCVVM